MKKQKEPNSPNSIALRSPEGNHYVMIKLGAYEYHILLDKEYKMITCGHCTDVFYRDSKEILKNDLIELLRALYHYIPEKMNISIDICDLVEESYINVIRHMNPDDVQEIVNNIYDEKYFEKKYLAMQIEKMQAELATM